MLSRHNSCKLQASLIVILLLALSVLCRRAVAGNGNNMPPNYGSFIQAIPTVSLNLPKGLNNSYFKRLDVAYLWFKGSGGDFDQTNDLYLSGYFDSGQPVILARLSNAIAPKLQVLDLDNNGFNQVLVEFTQGAAGKVCEIFDVRRVGYRLHVDRVDDDMLYSNLSKIDINFDKKLGKYVFKTVNDIPELLPSTRHKIVTRTLALQDGHMRVLSESSKYRQ